MDITTLTGRDELAARADAILASRGEYDPDAETYSAALAEAAAELSDDDDDRPVYTGSAEGEEIVVRAKAHLAGMGLYEGGYSEDQFMAAMKAAALELGIDLNARRP